MDLESLGTAIGAFLGGGAFKSLVDYWIKRRKNKELDSFEKLFEDIHKIYSILNEIKRATFAKRVLIIITENGGGVPSVDSELKSSILYEAYDYPFKSIKMEWQRQTLEDNHIKMLRNMYLAGHLDIDVGRMLDGIYKDALQSAGVKEAENHLLLGTEYCLYYLELHYDDKYEKNAVHRNIVRTSVSKLKPIFRERGKKRND